MKIIENWGQHNKRYEIICEISPGSKCICCWFHGPSIISAASYVVFWTFLSAKTCCVVCHSNSFCYSGTNMARKNDWKPHSIRLLRWFNFSQSGSRKNNRKSFEGASIEPTIELLKYQGNFAHDFVSFIWMTLILSRLNFYNFYLYVLQKRPKWTPRLNISRASSVF